MRVDLKAVPILVNSPPVPGAGAHRSDTEWDDAIVALRPRFMALSYSELCHLLRNMEMGDLVGLVISPPNDDALLDKFKEGLSEPVARILAKDCTYYGGNGPLSADFACGIILRTETALNTIETKRASPEKIEHLRQLTLELANFAGSEWYREGWLPSEALYPLISLTGGLTGPFGQHVKEIATLRSWEFFAEDYPDHANEPISRELADIALECLSQLIAGKPWPFDDRHPYFTDYEMNDCFAEMEKLTRDDR